VKSAFRITLVYLVFASLWIILSDRAIALFTDNVELLTLYSSIKGLFYVTITSAMLFVMIRNEISRRNAVIKDQKNLLEVKEDLIRELHHRVWNNIQVIIGVLGLETGDRDFSAKTKERIVKRLLSMRSVYDVVYNYGDMKKLSLGSVLAEYQRAESRNVRIEEPVPPVRLPVETLVSLLLVLDVILESVQESGYCDVVAVSVPEPGVLDLGLVGCADDLPILLGANESFVRTYLRSMDGDVTIVPGDPAVVRVTFV
jgi:hypothetical protein